jgi:hypothetical protein
VLSSKRGIQWQKNPDKVPVMWQLNQPKRATLQIGKCGYSQKIRNGCYNQTSEASLTPCTLNTAHFLLKTTSLMFHCTSLRVKPLRDGQHPLPFSACAPLCHLHLQR